MRPRSIITTALLLTAALAAVAMPGAALETLDPAVPAASDSTTDARECPPFHAETPFGGIALNRDCSVRVGTP